MPKLAIVCGGRDYNDYDRVYDTLQTQSLTFVIEGGATGADALARRAAYNLMIPHIEVPALWGPDGTPRIRKAGYDRNALMMKILLRLAGDNDKLVIAFPGGVGTKMMADIAERNHVRVVFA